MAKGTKSKEESFRNETSSLRNRTGAKFDGLVRTPLIEKGKEYKPLTETLST